MADRRVNRNSHDRISGVDIDCGFLQSNSGLKDRAAFMTGFAGIGHWTQKPIRVLRWDAGSTPGSSPRQMRDLLPEHDITCPYCWQTISLLIDVSAGSQEYVEDCSVCCRPISVAVQVENEQISGLVVQTDQ